MGSVFLRKQVTVKRVQALFHVLDQFTVTSQNPAESLGLTVLKIAGSDRTEALLACHLLCVDL